jgi:hypothetical protein
VRQAKETRDAKQKPPVANEPAEIDRHR